MNATGAPQLSHIHTPEWQSFEMRMRARIEKRRAARRRRRARWALGLTVVMLGGLAAVGVTLFPLSADATRPPVAAGPPLALVSSLAAIPTPIFEEALPEPGQAVDEATGTAGSGVPDEATPEEPAGAVVPEPQPPPPRPQATRARAETPERIAPPPSARSTTPSNVALARAPDRAPARLPARLPEPEPEPEPRVMVPATVTEPLAASGAPARVAAPTTAPTTAAAASAPPAPPPVVDPRGPVQQTIERYRAAYEQLDAEAARAVWPTVDRGALARAFSSLSAQQLTFEGCTIDVNGASARASCRGRARVVPRVGGGSETARRQWSFWLREANGGWVIEKAEIR